MPTHHRRVREYNAGEAKAYFLLTLCSRQRGEFYQAHYPIDAPRATLSRGGTGADGRDAGWQLLQSQHVLLITTKRIIFGTAQRPYRVIFEIPVERMARVELPRQPTRPCGGF